MIELEKGSDAELGYRTSTMTYEQAAVVLADRPDLLAMHRRLCSIDRYEWLNAMRAQPHSKPKRSATDVRNMTVRELCDLANEVRSAPAGSRKMRRAADRMAVAAWHLENSGALQQMLWWSQGIEPEAPDGKAEVVEMPLR